ADKGAVTPLNVAALPPPIVSPSSPLGLRTNDSAGGRTNPCPNSCTPATACDAANDSAGRTPKNCTTERVLSRRLLKRNDYGQGKQSYRPQCAKHIVPPSANSPIHAWSWRR